MVRPSISPDHGCDLQLLQRRRKYVLTLGIGACVVLLMVTASSWRTWPRVHELFEQGGLLLILLCILGRTWCTLYIGGLKKRELVRKGPYSVVRNPLYLFTFVGAAGVGAQSGSIANTLIFGAASLLIFYFVVLQEERFLAAAFPDAFAAYAARVPRFWPRLSLWEDAGELLVKPRLVHRTFLDASLFLLAVPITDLIDWGQHLGWFPVLLYLP
jgi:protein-S-isoprenylcysteine O-methyltransferase Ste14